MKKLMIALTALPLFADAVTVDYDAGNDGAIKFAAKDLERILSKVDGAIALRVDPSLKEQEWRFASEPDGRLVISGRDGMGIAYGVSTFLEKYCGVAWLAPDTEVIPPALLSPGGKLPGFAAPVTGRPAILFREMYIGADGMDGDWRLRNKETRRASYCNVNVGLPKDCHTFDDYVAAYRKEHPSKFGERRDIDGNLCGVFCSFDQEAVEFTAKRMMDYIEKDRRACEGKPAHVRPLFYDLSQSDGGGDFFCGCERCRALYEAAGGTCAAQNAKFVNAVAEIVGAKYPEVTIQTFAYGCTQKPPTNGVRYADNVNIRYCRSWLFQPLVATTENGRMLRDWSAHCSQFGIWSYWRTYRGGLYPFVMGPKRIAEEMRFCRDCGVTRYFAEDEAPLSRSFAMLQHWLFLQLAVDPDKDVNALRRQFFAGYYRKAVRPMALYLNYLQSVQEESRQYLNRAFFETANGYLDEAERLAQGDELALRHIAWERIVVDRAMYDGLAALVKQGFVYEKEKVSKRFAANVKDQIEHWSGFFSRHMQKQRETRLAAAESEGVLYSFYPVEMPAEFEGLEVEDLQWNRCKGARSTTVADPDACAGMAFYNNQNDVHKLPFSMGFYCGLYKRGDGVSFRTKDDVPQDEKFHLYKLGRDTIISGLYLTYDPTWENRFYMNTIGIIPENREVWVSMKFQGPNFVEGSTKENRVLFDRLLFVKNDNPMHGYEVAGGNLLGKPWKAAVKGDAKELKIAYADLGDPRKIDTALLVTGRARWRGLRAGKEFLMPSVGLWALTAAGKNSFAIGCVDFTLVDTEWRPFEFVIEKDRYLRHLKSSPEAARLTFRVNLCRQPGTVEVEDVKIIPVRKAVKAH